MAAKRKSTTLLHKEPISSVTDISETHIEDPYAGLMKDADKLKLMLLAWNYQNSAAENLIAVRNGTEGPDLATVGGLWAQYQNALAMTAVNNKAPISPIKLEPPNENQDETNSSGQKDDDDMSEDDSDDRLDQHAHDPERLKAFNMFVRLFVDENLDRMIPISKQPKEKIQAIIDSCTRQFPEFAERSRKRIRTYLKSCRRNKKTRDGWENTSRPTPAHLTSVQAEQILASACDNESMNAKRMRMGMEPISQGVTQPTTSVEPGAPSTFMNSLKPATETDSIIMSSMTPLIKTSPIPSTTVSLCESKSINGPLTPTNINNGLSANNLITTGSGTGLLTTSSIYGSNFTTNNYIGRSTPTITTTTPTPTVTQPYQNFFNNNNNNNNTSNGPTDLSMKQQPMPQLPPTPAPVAPCQQQQQQQQQQRPPLLSHKLNTNEMTAVRQLVTGYRESAAFLLRSADELEQLLLQQQN